VGLYERYVLPKLVHLACSTKPSMRQRAKVVPLAEGRVLEIGIGSGLNLPYYDAGKVTKLWGLEPSPELTRMAERLAGSVDIDVEFIGLPGEEIPLEDTSVDTALITYTLCTIPDTEAALRQVARVLRPGGRLIFCEHGAAPDARVRRWQDRLDPVWTRLAGGCHLNRAIPRLLEQGGFTVEGLETMYLPGWRPATFNYWGTATPR
jgi:ubiquinone/menaquinone biosynthesis C-methylase UbiE